MQHIQKKWKPLMYDLQSLNYGGTARDDCVWRRRVRVTGPAWAAFPADMVDWAVETTAPGRKLSLMTCPLLSSPRHTAVNLPQSPLRPRRRPSGWYYFCWAQRLISASVCAFALSILACHVLLSHIQTANISFDSMPRVHWARFELHSSIGRHSANT